MSKIPTPPPLPSAPPCPTAADRSDEQGKYERIGSYIGQVVDKKQLTYGDAFNKSVKHLESIYPDGIPVKHYRNALAMARIYDKFCGIATDNDPFGENPWGDVAGYSLLMNGRQEPARATLPGIPSS